MENESGTSVDSIERMWRRIGKHSGATFHTKTGKPFSYDCDGSTVRLRNTTQNLGMGEFAKALSRFPVTGPGALQDLRGPSYLFAILTDPRIAGTGPLAEHDVPPATLTAVPIVHRVQRPVITSSTRVSSPRSGSPHTAAELRELGFSSHSLRFKEGVVVTSLGEGTDWDTEGSVPDSPGLYLFTSRLSEEPDSFRVMYVGLTTHLWMVTKGTWPGVGGRGGQRYGRPKHAGETRKRVNVEITKARTSGFEILHWVKPVSGLAPKDVAPELRRQEKHLIDGWDLRAVGWNRA